MTPKQTLRNKADKLWKLKVIGDKTVCEVCGMEPINTAHHFFPKSLYGHLRYNLDNGVAICKGEHFAHHHKGDPDIHFKIVVNRGAKWYKELRDKSRETPASYQTIKYFKEQITKLI